MSRYRSVARIVARRSFAPSGALVSEAGAELRALIEELADPADAEWLLEENRADHRVAQFRGALEGVLRTYLARRMTPPLEQTSTPTFFRFAVRDDPREDGEVRALRGRLRLHDEMLAVLRGLDPTDFELLCGRVLREIGCDAVHVTRRSQDLGVDFFGRARVAELAAIRPASVPPRLRVLGDVYLLLFGQAKRYAASNTIDLDTIKTVEGTWGDIVRRQQNGSLPAHLQEGLRQIGWRAGDSVTLMFVTTSSYTDPALTWAVNAGMSTLDGDQVTQLLLECCIGVEETGPGAWSTSHELVTAACAV